MIKKFLCIFLATLITLLVILIPWLYYTNYFIRIMYITNEQKQCLKLENAQVLFATRENIGLHPPEKFTVYYIDDNQLKKKGFSSEHNQNLGKIYVELFNQDITDFLLTLEIIVTKLIIGIISLSISKIRKNLLANQP